MAKEPSSISSASAPNKSSNSTPAHKKLSRLPQSHTISKRPLLHPPISAPRTGASTPKIVYVSASSPFISTIKRVRKYLDEIESRAAGPGGRSIGQKREREVLKGIEEGITGKKDGKNVRDEEVLVKGTGKAIEKVLRIACYWLGQEGVKVVVRTGSVGAVDDVVDVVEKDVEKKKEVVGEADGMEVDEEGEGFVEESRIRRVSYLEVSIRLR